jgi:outer membrane cobalamin receptor
MTAIRQPITTGGVYLFLEDGLPTRPTGFFNHNGLYEIDIPNSGRVEVTKGPGSALYGSDAIGGIFKMFTIEHLLQPTYTRHKSIIATRSSPCAFPSKLHQHSISA